MSYLLWKYGAYSESNKAIRMKSIKKTKKKKEIKEEKEKIDNGAQRNIMIYQKKICTNIFNGCIIEKTDIEIDQPK